MGNDPAHCSFIHSRHGNIQTLDPWLLITATATTAILQLKLIVYNYYIWSINFNSKLSRFHHDQLFLNFRKSSGIVSNRSRVLYVHSPDLDQQCDEWHLVMSQPPRLLGLLRLVDFFYFQFLKNIKSF
jgi:hypothetical protein